jgi:hypothetical protein
MDSFTLTRLAEARTDKRLTGYKRKEVFGFNQANIDTLYICLLLFSP